MYIENIFICISIPLLLSLIFIQGEARKYTLFVCIGMGICVLSAYVSSFFMNYYGVDTIEASIEITPVCEEVMKLFPLLFYILIFEPQRDQIPRVAIAISVGFATFENVCYLTENGAADFDLLLIRGISTGELHILCGIFIALDLPIYLDKGQLQLREWLDFLAHVVFFMRFLICLFRQMAFGGGWGICFHRA